MYFLLVQLHFTTSQYYFYHISKYYSGIIITDTWVFLTTLLVTDPTTLYKPFLLYFVITFYLVGHLYSSEFKEYKKKTSEADCYEISQLLISPTICRILRITPSKKMIKQKFIWVEGVRNWLN